MAVYAVIVPGIDDITYFDNLDDAKVEAERAATRIGGWAPIEGETSPVLVVLQRGLSGKIVYGRVVARVIRRRNKWHAILVEEECAVPVLH